ncbi:MAG: sulfotransferase domain-containing protein [Hormoscilla sp. GUM202]|nr:sulfotransferase domain-containing protein [Hormoscilla sp. GUM202]
MTISDIKYTSKDKAVVIDSLRDSTIWDCITPRSSDIIIASCYKSGTTLTQQIVNLLIDGHDDFDNIHQLSPWVEEQCPEDSLNQKIERIEKLPDRRLFKTHLPFDALPYYPDWKYISLFRDGRDVGISLFNHLHSFTEEGRRNSPVYPFDGCIPIWQ